MLSIELLHNLGEAVGLAALLFTNVLHIRLVMIVSSLIFMITGASVGLNSMALWAIFYIVANSIQIALMLYAKRQRPLSEAMRKMHQNGFSNMTPTEFMYLFNLGRQETIAPGHLLKEGEQVKQLRFISQGEVKISQKNELITTLPALHFIGEMSFLSNGKASADVHCDQPVICHTWPRKIIRQLQSERPALYTKFIEALGRDIVIKLTRQYN